VIKKLIFVLLFLISLASFAEVTPNANSKKAVQSPKEEATQIINGQTGPYPDIIKAGKTPKLEDCIRPGMTQYRQMITP